MRLAVNVERKSGRAEERRNGERMSGEQLEVFGESPSNPSNPSNPSTPNTFPFSVFRFPFSALPPTGVLIGAYFSPHRNWYEALIIALLVSLLSIISRGKP